MKGSVVILFLVAVVLAVVSAFPADLQQKENDVPLPEEHELSLSEELEEEDVKGLRFRRVTCDLLSINVPIGSLNHSACAAHCLAMRKGFRGGRCKDGVCHCRK